VSYVSEPSLNLQSQLLYVSNIIAQHANRIPMKVELSVNFR